MSETTDWIIAFSSVAAAAGTVGTLYGSVATLRRQIDNDRRRQAARINVQYANAGGQFPVLQVRNSSDGTIYNVSGIVRYEDRVGMSETRLEQVPRDTTVTLQLGQQTGILALVAKDDAFGKFEVTFSDEAGHHWLRNSRGDLRELSASAGARPTWRQRLHWRIRRLLTRVHVIKSEPTPEAAEPGRGSA